MKYNKKTINTIRGLEKVVTSTFQKFFNMFLKENNFGEQFDVYFEGPNLVFVTGEIQYRIEVWEFKKKSKHDSYDNYIGRIGIVVSVLTKVQTKKELRKKIKNFFALLPNMLRREIKLKSYTPEGGYFPKIII